MARRRQISATLGQRRLLLEMARDERRIFINQHPNRKRIRYLINSFPMRVLNGVMVGRMAAKGFIVLGKRGYFDLTSTGMWLASREKAKEKKK